MIFNMVGGGGGSGATLVVSSPVNVSVTISKDDKFYTKNSGSLGSTTFKGLATGTWTVTISGNGQTATKTIEITADYAITIAFFSATINITYPANSTCVVADSGGQTIASDTNTGSSAKTWTATVNATGTYTVTATATDGSGKTKSQSVSITADGQSVSVALNYAFMLFDNGDQCLAVTGGWGVQNGNNSNASINSDSIYMGYIDKDVGGQVHSVYTVNKVALSGYKALKVDISVTQAIGNSAIVFGASSTQKRTGNSFAASITIGATDLTTFSVDISSINTDSYYVLFEGGYTRATIKKVWLE